jgi:hypothetical protein
MAGAVICVQLVDSACMVCWLLGWCAWDLLCTGLTAGQALDTSAVPLPAMLA